jgi:hypothetical protein
VVDHPFNESVASIYMQPLVKQILFPMSLYNCYIAVIYSMMLVQANSANSSTHIVCKHKGSGSRSLLIQTSTQREEIIYQTPQGSPHVQSENKKAKVHKSVTLSASDLPETIPNSPKNRRKKAVKLQLMHGIHYQCN